MARATVQAKYTRQQMEEKCHSSEIRERGVAAKKKTKSTRRNTYGYIIIDICKFLI